MTLARNKQLFSMLISAVALFVSLIGTSRAAPANDRNALAVESPRLLATWVLDRKVAKTWVITNWLEEPAGIGCVGGDRPLWDDMVTQWYESITDPGTYYEREFFRICATGHCGDYYHPGGAEVDSLRNDLFGDEDVVSWGEDHLHLDTADAAMLGWHGSQFLRDGIRTYRGVMSYEWGNGSCDILGLDMELGDTDLEFLHLSSCEGLSYPLWANWWRAFGGLHLLTGFHGSMWIREEYFDNYARFGDEAFVSSIADAWIDNLYDIDATETADQCPVVYGVGGSTRGVLTRMATERYNNVTGDPGSNEFWAASWIGGCRGDGPGPLPYQILILPIDTSAPAANVSSQQAQLASPEHVRGLVQQVLPSWDKSVLYPSAEGDWSKDLDFATVLRAMAGENASANWQDQVVMALASDRGRVYFHHEGRTWNVDRDGAEQAADAKTALEAVLAAAQELGIPMSELGAARVDTQLIGVAPSQPQPNSQATTYEMYRLVTLPRELATEEGPLPVRGSLLRAAVNRQGEIQRATISFPPFAMARGLVLRKRGDVIDQTVDEIMRRHPEQQVEIEAFLAYAAPPRQSRRDQRPPAHEPVVVVTVKTGMTPFSLTVPITR